MTHFDEMTGRIGAFHHAARILSLYFPEGTSFDQVVCQCVERLVTVAGSTAIVVRKPQHSASGSRDIVDRDRTTRRWH